MTDVASNPRSAGRAYLWAAFIVCLLGPAFVAVQFGLKHLVVPWYSPALATLGALLVLLSLASRRSIPRAVALAAVSAFAGFQWFCLVSIVKLPAFSGEVRAGHRLPAFRTTLADGRPFTDADFRDGSRHVMVFFRGRW